MTSKISEQEREAYLEGNVEMAAALAKIKELEVENDKLSQQVEELHELLSNVRESVEILRDELLESVNEYTRCNSR